MGCIDDRKSCSACFNSASGTIGARELGSTKCLVKVSNTVTDCKYYDGKITTTQNKADCQTCNSKAYINIFDNANEAGVVVTCSDTVIDTNSPVVCTAGPLNNCDQLLCLGGLPEPATETAPETVCTPECITYDQVSSFTSCNHGCEIKACYSDCPKNSNGVECSASCKPIPPTIELSRVLAENDITYTKGCRTCSAGYELTGTAMVATPTVGTINVGYPTCGTQSIYNCSQGIFTNKDNCYVCSSDYAVASANDTSCSAFTTDPMCRKLSSIWCQECKMSYYFKSQMCTLKAGLIGLSLLALLALFNY